MDSDSSLDGEFESKHEVAAARRNSAAAQSESDGEENDESDLSSTDSEEEKGSREQSCRDSSPVSRDGDVSESEDVKHSPSHTDFQPQSRSLEKENWFQSLDSFGHPGLCKNRSGSDQGKLSPVSNFRRHSSSSEDGKSSPSSEDGKHSPSSEDKHSPSSKDKHSPSSEDKHSSSEDEKHLLSSDDENHSRSSDDGKHSPSSEEGRHSPSSEVGKHTPSMVGGKCSPSYVYDKHLPVSQMGRCSPISQMERHTPISQLERHSSISQLERHSPISQLERHSPISQLERHSPISQLERHSPISQLERDSPISQLERHSPISEIERHSPISEIERHSPISEIERHSPISQMERQSPSSQMGRHSPISQMERQSPSSQMGRHSPSSQTGKSSPIPNAGKCSPNWKVGENSPCPNDPQSPNFHDKQCLRSPDPGKHTPDVDQENRVCAFYSRLRSPADKSPSTDYGKQSPGSGNERWTPSPDRGSRSPKLLRESVLGEESVGSCSGAPSLSGDTRSSRAWSPSPERDKHFRVANHEAQSVITSVSPVDLSVQENDGNTKEIISTSESGVVVSSKINEKQSPKLSDNQPSPISNICELSPILDHKKNLYNSPRSYSEESTDINLSKTNEKTLTAGHVSPNLNNECELSNLTQDILMKQTKLDGQTNDGEKEKKQSVIDCEIDKVGKKSNITSHGEDLSDVSDLEINDGVESLCEGVEDCDKKLSKGAPSADDVEQLDFEAEEREEGECEAREDGKSEDEGELKGDELEEGELTDDDENRPEETEPRPICRFYNRGQCTWGPNCRFLHPGVTDKGNYTMFDMVRPLVTINGPPIYPMEYRVPVPVPVPVPYEKPPPPVIPYQAPRKEEPPVFESAWERGLRQAKEMMRKSTKRKEMDMDFEEKKMNLSLGQDELDKENDYYTRQASPIKEEPDRWSSYERLKGIEPDGKYTREGSVFDEYPSDPYYHQHSRSDYWRRVQYEPGGESRSGGRLDSSEYRSSSKYRRSPSDHYYDKYEKKKKSTSSHSTREVIMQRVEKPWREERYAEVKTASSHRGRGDEWADPWMRSKSPSGRKGTSSRPTRKSYSSGSSYSSSSSSRSSSRSSYSSYSHDSHSRSRSKSFSRSRSRSRSRSPTARRRKPNRPLVPTARAAMAAGDTATPSLQRVGKLVPELRTLTKAKPTTATLLTASEKKAVTERAPLMNPPAPTPRKPKDARPPSPGMMRKTAQNPPAPSAQAAKPVSGLKTVLDRPKLTVAGAASIKAKMHSHSASSKSSSGSDSSGSSSDSSDSSYSSSSSSREPSPKALRPQKRMVIDERERLAFAQSMKIKAMDALKLSGQKQQIKLTLKTPGSLGGSTTAGAAVVKKPGTGLPELPELNLVRRGERVATLAGKKRPADETATPEQTIAAKMAALSKPAAKKATSRREELLKQLKAVEDAIARKRSKIVP